MIIVATQAAVARRLPSHLVPPEVGVIDDCLYRITVEDGIVGYIERVGTVFVALCGTRYSRAVEVGQSRSLDDAVIMVQRAFPAGASA